MRTEFKRTFLKEIKNLKNNSLKLAIAQCIIQVEKAENIDKIKSIKKLVGYRNYYRIRIGEYRIGLKIEYPVVYFVTVLHRKDIYSHFP